MHRPDKIKERVTHTVRVMDGQGENIAAASVKTRDIYFSEETMMALAAMAGKWNGIAHHRHHRLGTRVRKLPIRLRIENKPCKS